MCIIGETINEKRGPMKRNRILLPMAAAALLALAAVAAVLLPAPTQPAEPARQSTLSPPASTTSPATEPPDAEPPEIHGVHDLRVARYGTPAYRQGVTVTDNSGEASLEIDGGGVDTNTPGEYTVVYIARDAAGNETRVTAGVTVEAIAEAELAELADPVLKSVIKPGMSDTEKAQAIHGWIQKNITYNNTGEKNSVMEGAYNGLTLRRGDCYTYYALAKYLLEREGIASIDMRRVPEAATRHYWLAIDLGEGWHHYDACPVLREYSGKRPKRGFMMTESEAQDFARGPFNHPDYYRYDPAECLPEGEEIVP